MPRCAVALVAIALTLTGCGGARTPAAAPSGSSSTTVTGTVVVFAAASLRVPFTALAGQFQAAHPGTKVTFNFGGSDTLAAAITAGAPADVFAAASPKTMAVVTAAGDAVGKPTIFVRNELEIAVPAGNPRHIRTLADTVRPGTVLLLCAPAVPCGAAAHTAYAAARLTPHPASLEQDVTSVLTKIELNEGDAGLVYTTDVRAAGGKVTGVAFPEAATAITSYPIVTLTTGHNAAAARAFTSLVLSPAGAAVLAAAGFQRP